MDAYPEADEDEIPAELVEGAHEDVWEYWSDDRSDGGGVLLVLVLDRVLLLLVATTSLRSTNVANWLRISLTPCREFSSTWRTTLLCIGRA